MCNEGVFMKKLIYILLSFVFIVLAAGGWYFSGLIYEGGLNPEFPDTDEIGTAEDRILVSSIAVSYTHLRAHET